MNRMLNVTLPVEGIMALRNALGEEQAIAIAHSLELAQIRGEAELAAALRQEWQKELANAVAPLARREEIQELRREIAKLPNREELKRFATHEDLSELRSQFLRLDKKMTVGFLVLLALNLTSNTPLFIEWGTKVVGYALK
ncbi:hypothetical protein LMG3458_03430 [Achromobacter deleyi]|uniref:Uncharacterized protein n=2 Tax=Achromobacter deleyi TaxID=1353891 RepID=A0A6S7BHF9_9BURK|nr:hypothetical protein DDE05_10755 [Streptomyces cavourensis]CAB3714353.1 hypothetical protein LMG3458_03430 [Achromobacter deleyi]CAB3908170.1 hypothetical protein LMG3482_04673 [Achromobacter deleyi]CAB3908877.1 hypothetical protein LMG3412_04634 [Achromobacter deleyi]CAB3923423.1 hypothetical protein LMG3481_05561 [Achromobacter deleyi]